MRFVVRALLGCVLLGVAGAGEGSRTPPVSPSASRQARPTRLVAQLGHAGRVTSAVFSPDGRRVLTGGYDHAVVLWDAETGAELERFGGHAAQVNAVAFAPGGDRIAAVGGALSSAQEDFVAILWGTDGDGELVRLVGHSASVTSVAFSPDGRRVLTGSWDGTARLWDAATGAELRRFEGHGREVVSVAFSPDGARVLTGSWDRTSRLWDARTGAELRRFEGHGVDVTSTAFSGDGRFVLTGSTDRTARLWDAATGAELRRFEGHARGIGAVAFSPDGQRVLTGAGDINGDYTARLWDAETGAELRRFEGHAAPVVSVTFSPGGRRVLTASWDGTARTWSPTAGAELVRLVGRSSRVASVDFSPDGQRVLTGSWDGAARVWPPVPGSGVERLRGHGDRVHSAAFLPDGRRVLTGSGGLDEGTARLWDAKTGAELRRFEGHTAWVASVAVSSDGQRVVTGGGDGSARLWDAETGAELRRFEGHTVSVNAVALSPDGRRLLTADYDDARVWDAETGAELRRFAGHRGGVFAAAFSPDGRSVVTGGRDGIAVLWEVESGAEIRRFEGHEDRVASVAFSPDGRWVLTGSWDNTARIWDVRTGAAVRRLEDHPYWVISVAFSPDGRRALTGGADGATRLWSTEHGSLLATLVSFADGTWAVVDSEGRYDASNGGDVEGLHWVVEAEPVALHQLKERYYEPALLAKLMGLNGESLRNVRDFGDVALYPAVEVLQGPTAENPAVRIALRNRGGGIGRVAVSLNGKEIASDARPAGADPGAESLTIVVDVAGSPFLAPADSNRVEVRAFNAEGYLSSRSTSVGISPSAAPGAPRAPPHLWAVVVGVSDYAGDALDLRYAAKDAEDVAAALELAAGRLFGSSRTHLTLLTTGTGVPEARAPTRSALVRTLEALADSAAPGDVLVVYLAGHGVVHGGVEEGDYYYLAREAASGNLEDPVVRDAVALSSSELARLLTRVPALKQVLILDTCGAGRAVEILTQTRDVPSSQVRAIQRLKDRTGMFVLAGSAADAVSYEASRYAQGLLTYTLLLGMKGAALREGEYLDVATLFGFAVDQVPRLAMDIGGVQRPELATPRGSQSFDLGRLMSADRERIALAEPKPLVLRSNFQDETRFRDHLGLTRAVDDLLRERSARPRGAPLVFVDAAELPDAHTIVGRYRLEGEGLVVRVVVYEGEEQVDAFTVEGSASDLLRLAEAILNRTEAALAGESPSG